MKFHYPGKSHVQVCFAGLVELLVMGEGGVVEHQELRAVCVFSGVCVESVVGYILVLILLWLYRLAALYNSNVYKFWVIRVCIYVGCCLCRN